MQLRRLNNRFTHGALKGRKQLLLNTQINSSVSGHNNEGRPYFTFMDRVKDAFRVPMRHVESFMEPHGKDYESQLPNTENLYGNTLMVFNAYLTHNAFEMNTWHDMDNTVHNQFGTVDNPVLIFTSDSSWRIVICQGPGVEDDSHSHEKMFYFLREGPMNRCHICGQCFKLVRLKDEFSEINDYYSFMFSSLTHFDVKEEDANIPLHTFFGDRPAPSQQTMPSTNVYVHVNPDEADHMLVDPAYKLERLEEAHERLQALHQAYRRADQSYGTLQSLPISASRTIYSNWFEIEKSIRRLDRIFLKVEKFNARQFIDQENHERREQRMLTRKRERWTDNYTYFFGGLTEEEQMYRDYFQTDLEEDPEDDVQDELMDEIDIANTGEFTFDKYEFIESNLEFDTHESLLDVVDQKIFKYKYRMNNDDLPTYLRRMDRVAQRQITRAKNRDPYIENNLAEVFERAEREDNAGVQTYNLIAEEDLEDSAEVLTEPIRDYMLKESLQQYKDYFESDEEEQNFFEYLDELPVRDRLKFMEIFEDYTIPKRDGKGFVKIPKREYNPELSFFSNIALDLVDFKQRVVPLAKDAARLDSTYRFQRMTPDETVGVVKEGRKQFNKFLETQGEQPINFEKGADTLSSEEMLSIEEHLSDEVSHGSSTVRDTVFGHSKTNTLENTERDIIEGKVADTKAEDNDYQASHDDMVDSKLNRDPDEVREESERLSHEQYRENKYDLTSSDSDDEKRK